MHGLGDNRSFAGNDPSKTFRIQVSGTVEKYSWGVRAKLKGRAGESEAVVAGIEIGRQGEIKWSAKITSIDKNGNIHLQVTITGINGWSGAPGAPEGDIRLNVNLVVTPDGKVGIEGGDRTAYPSAAVYSYNIGADGKITVTTHLEAKEGTIDALTKPTVPIEPVPASCNCDTKKPQNE